MTDKVRGFKRQKNDNSTCDRKGDLFFFSVRGTPAFLTTDRLWGFALRPLRIQHQGDRIRTYGSLKLLHQLFGRIFLKRIVTKDDLCDDSGQHVCLPDHGWTTGLCTSAP